MKIQDLLQKKHVLIDIGAEDKTDLISRMGSFLASAFDLRDPELIVRKLLERESDMSTGIGFGVAIPHTRIDGLDRPYMVAARCRSDMDYDAIDERPVRLVFMTISPSNTATEHTANLSAVSKVMSSGSVRQQLINTQTPAEFVSVIADAENRMDQKP